MLLDTNCFIWLTLNSPRLGTKTKERILSTPRLYLSSFSILELRLKIIAHKLKLGVSIQAAIDALGVEVIPYNYDHALHFSLLGFNKDPFDNALCGVAIRENLVLFTSDKQILSVEVLDLQTWDIRK